MSWYLAQRSGPCAVFHRTKIQLPTGYHCAAPYLCFSHSPSCIAYSTTTTTTTAPAAATTIATTTAA
ncbi:hypothetical protein K445DRAFT_314854 [Daldinia sp. EC12]|nr:hypothetical protein K445DRAFT_314854 [Daldinia sp. EC12]